MKNRYKFRAWDKTMREIKFRVWDTDFKKMLLVNDAKFVNGVMIGAKGVSWDSKVVIMQFTGLKDKNSREIFESDILKDYGEVVWVEQSASFRVNPFGNKDISFMESFLNMDELEVIGNVYENPELLK